MPPKTSGRRGSKKGGSKKKKDSLTVQERNAITRQKMAAEKEKRRNRRRLTKIFLKVKNAKEYGLLKSAQQELLIQWRPVMRDMRKAELLKEFKLMQSAYERSFEKKNELIKELEDQLRKNEKDYDDALDNHMYNVDKMLEFFRKRIFEVKTSYAHRKKSILDGLNAENFRMNDNHDKSMQYLSSVKNSVEQRYKDISYESKSQMQLREEEIMNKSLEDGNAATLEYEEKMRDVWDDIRRRLTAYDKSMHPLRGEFLKLREKDDASTETIDIQYTRMHTLKNGTEGLESQMDALSFAVRCYLKELQEKKSLLRGKYMEEQERHRFHINKSGRAIRHLALTLHSISGKIEENMKKRERLLLVIERCRKQERLDEKVDPFMIRWAIGDLLDDNIEEDVTSARLFYGQEEFAGEAEYVLRVPNIAHSLTCDCNPCMCELGGEGDDGEASLNAPLNKLVNDYSFMERFWLRFNRVSLEVGALSERRDILVKDNVGLKVTLRNYVGGLNPLEYNPTKISEKALEEDKKKIHRFMRAMQLEYQRQQRSYKVGGIKMH